MSQVYYYKDGQKMFEGSPEAVESGGVMTAWYRSGQKMAEIKDGRLTRWSENGEVIEVTPLTAVDHAGT